MEKSKKYEKRILQSVIACLAVLIFSVLISGIKVNAASFNWSSLPAIDPDNYVNISSDTSQVSMNASNTVQGYANSHYNTMMYETPNRLTYGRKIAVSPGVTVRLIGSNSDSGSGAALTQTNKAFYWSVVEFDANGYGLYDSGWMETTTSWTIGSSTGGGTYFDGITSRSSVAYIIVEFRINSGNASFGDGTEIINSSILKSRLGNIYLAVKPFSYILDCNGGNINGASTLTYKRYGVNTGFNGTTGKLANPTRTGYAFRGWKVISDTSISPDWMNGNTYSTSVINSYISSGKFYNSLFADVTFTAQWTANTYKVNFNANGGEVDIDSKTAVYDSVYGTLPVPERIGYEFLGWFTSSVNGTQYTAGTRVTTASDHTLYAHWKVLAYTVTYDANGGSEVSQDASVVKYKEQVDLNPTAAKNGYIFVGWNTDPEAKDGFTSFFMPAENITLYAIYSIPVSDVKELYIQTWVPGNTEDYRIFRLTRTGEKNMHYTYELPTTGIAADFGNVPVACSLFAWDHAGNYRIIKNWYPDEEAPEEPVVPEWFVQTVKHYRYDIISEEWVLFETVSEKKMKGETYTPQYITPPTGYQEDHIDEPYVVEKDMTKGAYYSLISYTLTFEPNGGTCNLTSKRITYGEAYGELPAATRQGYTFLGWYTEERNGIRVSGSDKYKVAGDSTLYAHWKINEYTVYYDYRTNGGTSADKESEVLAYGSNADLQVSAEKAGWQHIGWNTDPEAVEGITSYVVRDKDVTLYAVYKKVITVTYVDIIGQDTEGEPVSGVTKESLTLYNRAKEANFIIPKLNGLTGWQEEGFSLSEEAEAVVDAAPGTTFGATADITFYGRYRKEVTVSYDTNGSAERIQEETKIRQYNASGQVADPEFTLADAPKLEGYSFINWRDKEGNGYRAGQVITCIKDTLLAADWDEYPRIEAYDRYFSLEQAQKGEITTTVLLEKVTGTDREDGILTKGRAVIVINYQPEDFTRLISDGSISITYQAVDSFGNTATKTITVHVVDTSLKKDQTRQYLRFINSQFYMDGTDYVTPELGGLENLSVWKRNTSYKTDLDYALFNEKVNQKTLKISLFGREYEVLQPGSGSWKHHIETWKFTKAQLEDVKEYIDVNGYGNYKAADGLADFRSRFLKQQE